MVEGKGMAVSNKRVMGIGSNVVDVIYRVNQIAGAEQKTYILPDADGNVVREVVGGVTLNHLSWAQLLGVPCGLFGYQGDDRYGLVIRATMNRHKINREHVIIQSGGTTGFSVIYVDPEAERAIYMSRGPTGRTTPEDIRRDFAQTIQNAAIVSTEISQLPLNTVLEVLRTAKEAGVPTILDVDVPPDFCVEVAKLGTGEELEQAISLADVLKPAKAAASQLTGATVPEAQAEALLSRYSPKLVAITDGRRGSVFTDGKQTLRMPAREVQAVDTTGAGDAFLGGLIVGLHRNLSLPQMAKLANACGAACCLVLGAFPVLGQSRYDVMHLYEEEWPLHLPDEEVPKDAASHVGVQTIRKEATALQAVGELTAPEALEAAAQLIFRAEIGGGRTHVTGVGKCRHIAHKIAATLQSTGTAAYFLDPLDANHGDSGQVVGGDVVIAISHSGKTAELLAAVETVKRNGAQIIALTGERDSALARLSHVLVHIPVEREADPLGLAPTSSTICQLAVGDALAMTLAAGRRFSREDFARYHPGGSLGEKLRTYRNSKRREP